MGWNGTQGRCETEVSAPKRILVTGGSGFIGSHLSKTLLSLGNDVLVVDNFYSSSRHNVLELLGEPGFELMRHDVTFPLYVEVDQIYHLACPASPVFYQRDPVQTTKTCVHGSINMLGLAKRLRRADPARLDLRGLRRPGRAPAVRVVLGQREPHRHPVLLRRGQAVRGDAVLRLPPAARAAGQGGPDLQHLRPQHAAERRPRGVGLHRRRPCAASRSPSSATARRPGRSATSTTWSTG